MEKKNLFILDLDGVVLDSRISNAIGFIKTFEKNGFTPPSQESVIRHLGEGAENETRIHMKESGQEAPEEMIRKIAKEQGEIHAEILDQYILAFQNVPETLNKIYSSGNLIVAATSGTREEQEKALKVLGIHDYFLFLHTSSDSAYKKTDPRFIGEIVDRVKSQYEIGRIFFVDDKDIGITVAKQYDPNIFTIYAKYGYEGLENINAHLVIDDFGKLREVMPG